MKILDSLLAATRLTKTPLRTGQFDSNQITHAIHRALASAGLDTQSGPLKSVTDTIQQALSAAGLHDPAAAPSRRGVTIEGTARDISAEPDRVADALIGTSSSNHQAGLGEFLSRSFTNHAGTRAYKLYVPASYWDKLDERLPMVVMLHGCTQSPDDFAAGTQMNSLAEQHGFMVVYPAQCANANGAKCWNWFRSEDQSRESGEPALIAGITREVAASYRIDERRIFVAGMSAGAAMAVVLGATYPELYAAVGAHSGLPYGAAHNMASAFGAMQGSAGRVSRRNLDPQSSARGTEAAQGVSTIIFHGDGDRTVDARNAAAIVEQATAACSGLSATTQNGVASGGRAYTRTVYADAANRPVVEHWLLHGAGHAWSGGSASGSFTDASGPDASAEMIRFFFAQQRCGTA